MVDAFISGTPANGLAEMLGLEILIAMHAGDVDLGIRSLANRFTAALRSEAIARGRMRDRHGKLRKIKWEVAAIIEGGKIFERTGDRPRRRAILKVLKVQGYIPRGKRAAERDLFNRAKLSSLPW